MSAFRDWLMEVDSEDLTVDATENGLNREARSNQWGFSFVQEQIQTLSLREVTDFLDALVESYNHRLSQPEYQPAMIFYCWFDPQASSLRFSLVSASHNALPFGAPIELLDGSQAIVQDFLDFPYHDGIPLSEMTLDPSEMLIDSVEVKPGPLQVWAKKLPTRTLHPSGLAEGQFVVPDDFDDPLPPEIQRYFEGYEDPMC